MMPSSAAMTSVRSTSLLRNCSLRLKVLVGGRYWKTKAFGRPSLGLGRGLARLLARHGAWPSRVNCSMKRDHFLGRLLPNYL